MKPISELSREEVEPLAGVLFDLDDTLLDHGLLTERAYGALHRLSRAGLRLVAVTGRPAGWGNVIARQWPIDAVVTENGAIAAVREGGVVRRWDPVDAETRRARRIRLAQVYEDLRGRFAEARMSEDTEARLTDIALDIGETQRVPPDVVEKIAARAHEQGVRTFVSTVHLHLTLETADKASGTLALLLQRFGEDAARVRSRYAYVGDSPNDDACFCAFSPSFGVKNVEPFLGALSCPPAYVASQARGAGFAEVAARLLELRGGPEAAPH